MAAFSAGAWSSSAPEPTPFVSYCSIASLPAEEALMLGCLIGAGPRLQETAVLRTNETTTIVKNLPQRNIINSQKRPELCRSGFKTARWRGCHSERSEESRGGAQRSFGRHGDSLRRDDRLWSLQPGRIISTSNEFSKGGILFEQKTTEETEEQLPLLSLFSPVLKNRAP